jgi:hypothetical protein
MAEPNLSVASGAIRKADSSPRNRSVRAARPNRMMSYPSDGRRSALAVASLALLALVSGCAQPSPAVRGSGAGPSSGAGPGPGTYAPDDLVLRVELVHGFMREYFVAHLPIVSVYGDGRVITEGPATAISPYPALPDVRVRRITSAGVDALVVRALERGVGRDLDFGRVEVYDAPGTKFTVLTDSGQLVTDVYALDSTDDSRNLTDAQRSARRALQDLIADLTDLPTTLGADSGEEVPYVPEAMVAISRPWTEPGSMDQPAQPERVWPGPVLPGDPMGMLPEIRCVTVTGAEVTAVVEAAETANALTPWTSGGHRWAVDLRPLLPDEGSCAHVI